MTHLLDIYFTQFLIFVLVLGRIGGLVMTAPIFGSRSVPLQVRGLIAIGLALLITPLHWREEVADSGSILGLTLLLVEEIMRQRHVLIQDDGVRQMLVRDEFSGTRA